ncbi:hypothetical protein [Mucilaginibacter rubeus]|uniref:Uncharacterized protein n=1 Tax=Mucilaginibacter rubeus TaxID=2027860 RepID=A0A5C1HW72_9SPHI|nr:hypothetical protein [Mucilaginibacter rubeus]QEM09048.1 hypothetical protein DEO27_003120 [Mucilaginibacter rubeus]
MKTIKFSAVLAILFFFASQVQAKSFITKSSTKDSLIAIHNPRVSDYKVLENGPVIIYERSRPGDKLNLFKPIITHYFSVKGTDKVYLLTLENLKKIYNSGPHFETLDTRFRTDSDLLTYDRIHRQYSVNYYLSKADAAQL